MEQIKAQLLAICDEALASEAYTDVEKAEIARLRAYIQIHL